MKKHKLPRTSRDLLTSMDLPGPTSTLVSLYNLTKIVLQILVKIKKIKNFKEIQRIPGDRGWFKAEPRQRDELKRAAEDLALSVRTPSRRMSFAPSSAPCQPTKGAAP